MQSLQNRSRSTSDGYVQRKNSAFEATAGYDTNLENYFQDHKVDLQLIRLASRKLPLSAVFPKYRVRLEEHYSSKGWTQKGRCPFTDHNDGTPSFGYNPGKDLFNCFGCHRAGRSVEFISYIEGRRKIDVAREILSKHSTDEEISFEALGFDYEKLQQMLFEYAEYVRKFKLQNNSNEAYVYSKAVTWNLDVYIRKHGPSNTMNLEDLEARLDMLKDQLDVYEENK